MSLPATRFSLPHVGAARNQRPDPAACTDPKIRGLLWCRQLGQWTVRPNDVSHLQRGHLQDFPQAPAASIHAGTTNNRGAGQCSISPRETPRRLPSQQCAASDSVVPSAVQSSVGSNRARLETDSAPRHPQPLLRHAARSAQSRQRMFRSMAKGQQCLASIMLHYLRRCV
jgi:hypothetical protein